MSSQDYEFYPTTSLHKNCIEFESQTDRNHGVDFRLNFSGLNLKLVYGCGYDT